MLSFNSIKSKLLIPIADFTAATAVFNATYYPAVEQERINRHFHQQLDHQLNTLILRLQLSFRAGDLDGVRQTADLLKRDRQLAFLLIQDAYDTELLRHGESDTAALSKQMLADLGRRTLREVEGYVLLKDQIHVDGEVLGTAIVGLSTAEREAAKPQPPNCAHHHYFGGAGGGTAFAAHQPHHPSSRTDYPHRPGHRRRRARPTPRHFPQRRNWPIGRGLSPIDRLYPRYRPLRRSAEPGRLAGAGRPPLRGRCALAQL